MSEIKIILSSCLYLVLPLLRHIKISIHYTELNLFNVLTLQNSDKAFESSGTMYVERRPLIYHPQETTRENLK